MRIKLRTLMAGPDGVRQPGLVHEVDRAEAYRLIEAGVAEQVDEPEKAVVAAAETATAAPQRKR